MALEDRVVEAPQPVVECRRMASVVGRQRRPRDETGGRVHVAARHRVLDRQLETARGRIPGRRPQMELLRRSGLPSHQLGLEVVPQQAVVAVRLLFGTDLRDEQVRARQRRQSRRGPGHPDDGLRDPGLHRVKDRRASQERDVIVPEGREKLRLEVLGDEATPTGHVADRDRGPAGTAGRERRKVDGRRPSLGPFDEMPRVVRRQMAAGRRGHRACLFLVERQRHPPDLQQAHARPEAPERQVRPGPRRDRDLDIGRQVVQEHGERVERGPIDEAVCIVEDEHGRATPAVHLGCEPGDRVREDLLLVRRDRGQDRAIDRLDPVECRGKVRQEDRGVVVLLVERQPRHLASLDGYPFGEQRGLAVPGWAHDRHDRGTRLCRQDLEKSDAPDHPGTRPGGLQPGLDERDRRRESRASARIDAHVGMAVGQHLARNRQLVPRAEGMASQRTPASWWKKGHPTMRLPRRGDSGDPRGVTAVAFRRPSLPGGSRVGRTPHRSRAARGARVRPPRRSRQRARSSGRPR